MNTGIKVIRHENMDDAAAWGNAITGHMHKISTLFINDTDEELIASVVCMRLMDDEYSSTQAKECHTIHVWPPWLRVASVGETIFNPDPRCVELRTAALHRWNGTAAPEPIVCGKD